MFRGGNFKEMLFNIYADLKKTINGEISNANEATQTYADETIKPELDLYVENTSKPSLDDYVTNIKKPELDTHTTTKKGELDTYESTKESELDSYRTGTVNPAIDIYTTSKKGELDNYKDEKITEINNSVGTVQETDVTDSYTGNDPEKVVSQKALYDALATVLKLTGGTLTGDLILNGKLNVDSGSGARGLFIQRGGGLGEAVQHYVDDSRYYMHYVNDETSCGTRFFFENTDTEAGGGASANTGYVEFVQDNINGTRILINGDKVYHEGNKPTPADIGAIGDAGHSMSTSSYQKLSTGLIIQRGAISCPSGSTTTPTVTFPVAFSSTNYTVVYTISNSSYTSYDTYSWGVSSMTAGSCKLLNDFNSNTKTLYWTAIGY